MSTPTPTDPAPYGRQPAAPPQVIIQQQAPTAFGRYGKLLLILLGVCVMVIIGQNASYKKYFSPADAPLEKYHSLSKGATDKVAIIRVEGTILDPDGFVKKQIDRVREDEDVKAIVLRVDSPGGTVTASDYLYHELKELVKDREIPMVVSMGSICASGGYYLAMAGGEQKTQEDVIFAEPSTWTGSIGVVIPHYDVSELLTSWKVKDDSVASHKYKLMGSPTRDLSPEERAEERKLLQTLVDQSFARFKTIVEAGRPKLKGNEAELKKATTGQIFTAEQAQELGLIDKIGFMEAAIERAAELAGKETDNVRCVEYDKPPSPLTALLGADSQLLPQRNSLDFAGVLDLTAPRAYYLCTWLPAILSNTR
jgi:protease-4